MEFGGLVQLSACVPPLAIVCGCLINRERKSEKEKKGIN